MNNVQIIFNLFLILITNTSYLYGEERDPGQKYPQKNYTSSKLAPFNLEYFEISTRTGGDFYFWAPNEFSSKPATEILAKSILRKNEKPLLYQFGELSGKKQEYTIFLSENLPEVFFLIGIQSKNKIHIYKPNGELLSDSTKNSKVYNFIHMMVATVTKPVPGNWKIEIAGTGKYLVSVRP